MRRIELEEDLGTVNGEWEHTCGNISRDLPCRNLDEDSLTSGEERPEPAISDFFREAATINFEPYHLTGELTGQAPGAGHCAASPAPRLVNLKARRPKY